MRILSLGAGVQSSTLLLMACQGEEQLDAAIFADTQWEPQAVYDHLTWLTMEAATAGITVYRVTAGNLRADALDPAHRFASMPLFVEHADGTAGMVRRQCTKEYKIAPIRKEVRRLIGEPVRGKQAALLMGISLDEWTRMRDSDVRYIRHEYPLVDRKLTRHDCLLWMERHGYPRPPKSACIGCPFRRDTQWRELREQSEVEWKDAVAFDAAIRHSRGQLDRPAYLHRSLVPLDEVDLRSRAEQSGQSAMFEEECAGVCGV